MAYQEEPATYAQAIVSADAPKWQTAMDSEYDSLIKNGTWSLCELPAGRKAVGCKWVYKVKTLADGTLDKYKARLVAKGYSQVEGVDYDETFAPVVKYKSLRVLLSFAAADDMEVTQMDVKTAFLHGDLQEEIYMEQPLGYSQTGSTGRVLVCRLKKSLYGLKQAPRCWNAKINTYLKSLGFIQSDFDVGVYYRRFTEGVMIIALYVDDLFIHSKGPGLLELKSQLSRRFEMTDLGNISSCLGMSVMRDRVGRTISLSQKGYVESLLAKLRLSDCEPIGTPLDHNVRLTKEFSPKTAHEREDMMGVPYRQAVGSLMHVMQGTRPDLALALCILSKFNSDPGRAHWEAVKRVFRYLKGTLDYALVYGGKPELTPMFGYCDADHGNDLDTSKSVSGWTFLIGGTAVSWRARQQKCVSRSVTESEYYAAGETAAEAEWLRRLMAEVGHPQDQPTRIYSDNQGSIALIKNPVFHDRSKHIRIQYHYVRQLSEEGIVKFEYCPAENMAADFLTKPLDKISFHKCREALGIKSLHV